MRLGGGEQHVNISCKNKSIPKESKKITNLIITINVQYKRANNTIYSNDDSRCFI